MLSHFGRALRALAAAAVLCVASAPVSAHEGHDHGEQQPVSAGALPRGEADSNSFEIVAIVRGENLEIYLDRFATNEPVMGATLEVESPGGPVKAAANADGTYRVAAPWLANVAAASADRRLAGVITRSLKPRATRAIGLALRLPPRPAGLAGRV